MRSKQYGGEFGRKLCIHLVTTLKMRDMKRLLQSTHHFIPLVNRNGMGWLQLGPSVMPHTSLDLEHLGSVTDSSRSAVKQCAAFRLLQEFLYRRLPGPTRIIMLIACTTLTVRVVSASSGVQPEQFQNVDTTRSVA